MTDETDAARLLFISRSWRMGLSCEQIIELLPIWDDQLRRRGGTSPPVDRRQAARDRARIAELEDFSSQLEIVEAALQASAPPAACRTDLSCCVPETNTAPMLVELGAKRPHAF